MIGNLTKDNLMYINDCLSKSLKYPLLLSIKMRHSTQSQLCVFTLCQHNQCALNEKKERDRVFLMTKQSPVASALVVLWSYP